MPKMRLGWYAGVSTALAGSVVISAFHQRPNFYSAMVYLSQSNFCLLVLVNFTLFLYSSFLYGLTRVCFGPLRAIEVEQLTERAWFAITETCLAMTIFREEIGAWFLVMFTALVSGKVWGWIADGRVDVLEQQPPANPRLFHLRLSFSVAFSVLYDLAILRYTVLTVIQQARPNMMVMFLFEFAVLSTVSLRTALRYFLSVTEQAVVRSQTESRLADRRREVRLEREETIRQREQAVTDAAAAGEEAPVFSDPLPSEDDVDEMDIEVPGWAAKGEWVLWLDLFTDMIKLAIYSAFFFMLLVFYGLPIHIIRDLFMTSRDFLKRLNALLRYRRAIQEMNQYPDATAEELADENTCIICREEMHPWDPVANPGAVDRVRPKKLPCGHTLHLGCLKSWLERQQVCPTCRSPVTSADRARQPAPGGGAAGGNRRLGLRIQLGGGQAQPPQAPQAPQQPQQQPGPADDAQNPPQPQQAPQAAPGDRPRIFNLGPLRLGFGANGAQVRELARQFGMPQAAQAAHQPGVATAPATPQPGVAAVPPPGDNLHNAASLLLQAEQALQSEMQALHMRQQELQTSQLLLAELQRLRLRQQQQTHDDRSQTPVPPPPFGGMGASSAFPHAPFGGAQFPGFPPARTSSPFLGRHGTSAYTTSIPAGSPDLPDGVVLPQGWSLMPLQRLDGGGGPTAARQPSSSSLAAAAAAAAASTPPTAAPGAPSGGTEQQADTTTPRAAVPPPAEPTVVSPSPVAPPNWGGSGQLFGTSGAGSSVASQASNSERPASTASPSPAPADKGKARAATVEDASDEEDEEEESEEEEESDKE